MEISGKDAFDRFFPEAGVHRWQRVPPTEKRGRRQSSTITVAVLNIDSRRTAELIPSELEETTCRGSGPGGQHKNKTDSCVVLKHVPSGVTVRIDNERSQSANRAIARDILSARLQLVADKKAQTNRNHTRRKQVGDSDRSEKIRTVQEQNGKVVNHASNKKCSLKEYLKGKLELIQ
jgi:peptide chain release factor 1